MSRSHKKRPELSEFERKKIRNRQLAVQNLYLDLLSKKGRAGRTALVRFLQSPYPGMLDRLEAINHALRSRIVSSEEYKTITPPISLEARKMIGREAILTSNPLLKWFEFLRADYRARRSYDADVAKFEEVRLISAWILKLASGREWYDADGPTFEKLVAYFFSKNGYDVWNRGGKNDRGVDLVIQKGDARIVVQCKAYRRLVGPAVVRELYGTMLAEGAHSAILATMLGISLAAREWIINKPITVMTLEDFVSDS